MLHEKEDIQWEYLSQNRLPKTQQLKPSQLGAQRSVFDDTGAVDTPESNFKTMHPK